MGSFERWQNKPAALPAGNSISSLARKAQQARQHYSQDFPKDVFRDSAWDIMLALVVVAEEGPSLCVKDMAAISGESATGALRRIERLEDADLILRRRDPHDHRRVLVELTEEGRAAMASFLQDLFNVDVAPEPTPEPLCNGSLFEVN